MSIDRMRVEAVLLLQDLGWKWDGMVWDTDRVIWGKTTTAALGRAPDLVCSSDEVKVCCVGKQDEIPTILRDFADELEQLNDEAVWMTPADVTYEDFKNAAR